MNPFSSQYDKGKSNIGQLNLSKSDNNNFKRTTQDVYSSFDNATKRIKPEMYSDNPGYNDYNQPMLSSFPNRRTMREANLPEPNYYSQPLQSLGNRYYDPMPMRESIEEETNLREQNKRLQLKLDALTANFQQLIDLRHTEAENSLVAQEHVIQEINKRSKVYSERMELLEECLGKLTTEDTNVPTKADSKETPELKLKVKKLQKMCSEALDKEKKLKHENKVLKELAGLIIKESKTKEDGIEYKYNLTGLNGSLDFTLFIPNYESKQVIYTPLIEPNSATISRLPDFLNTNIEFERNHLNRFFWRLSSTLYEGNDESGV